MNGRRWRKKSSENYELNDPIAKARESNLSKVYDIVYQFCEWGITLTDESGGLTGSVQEIDLMMRISVPAQFRFYSSR